MSTFEIDIDTLDKIELIFYVSSDKESHTGQTREYLFAAYPNMESIIDWHAVYRDLGWWLFYEEILKIGRDLNLVHLYRAGGSPSYKWHEDSNYWDLIKFKTEIDFENAYDSLGTLGQTTTTIASREQHPSGKDYQFWAMYHMFNAHFSKKEVQLNWKRRHITFSFVEFNPKTIRYQQAGCLSRVSKLLGTSNLSSLNWLVNRD